MGIQQTKLDKQVIFTRQYGFHKIIDGHAVKQYELTSDEEQRSFQTLVSMYQSFDVPTVLPIINGASFNNQNGIIYGWRLTFKYLPTTLQDQINFMISRNLRYSQQQLLKAIDCILSALMGFKLKKLIHGDINCHTIFIDNNPYSLTQSNNNGQISKIYTLGLPLLLNSSDVETMVKQKRYDQLYLSPHSLSELENQKPKPTAGERNDVFSLGLVILRMASLTSLIDIYDFQHFKLKERNLQRTVFECRKHYSLQFCNILQKMTARVEQMRPDLQQIFNQYSQMTVDQQQNQQQIRPTQTQNQKLITTPPKNNLIPISTFHNHGGQTPPLFTGKTQSQSKTQKSQGRLFGNGSGSGSKNRNRKKQQIVNTKLICVQSRQLIQSLYVGPKCWRAWEKFCRRMDNKMDGRL